MRERGMAKKLTEMTLDELWELFPISLVEHDETWARQYEGVEAALRESLAGLPVDRISHIGSTAVRGIRAKGIVDVLVELPEGADMEEAADRLERGGFTRMSERDGRVSLNRGYTPDGFADEVFHVHLRFAGDNDELYFRDYLNAHPEAAAEYEALKVGLCERFEHDRDAYTEAKSDFIGKRTAQAKSEYAGRY
jgi:GrpB-like predicted nucleotidyltransferase (UPF0157 family)